MNIINLEDVLYAPPLIIESYNGAYLAIDPEFPNWLNTNQYGIDAIRLVNGHKTTRHIIDDLARMWQGSEETVKKDVVRFFSDVLSIGVLAKEPFKYLPFTGRHKYLNYSWLSDLSVCLSTRSDFSIEPGKDSQEFRLSKEDIVGLIDEAIDLGCRSVVFTGGEPFLLDYFPALIKQYGDKGLTLYIVTNGDLISEELISDISSDVNFILSLQGSSAKLNDAMRGSSSFAATIGGLNKLVSAGFSPIVQTIVSESNLSDIIPTAELLINTGVKKIKLNWQRQESFIKKTFTNKKILDTRALLTVLKKLSDTTAGGGVNLLNKEFLNANLYQRGVKMDLCSGGVDSLAVFADGESYPCQWLFGREQFKMGNIHNMPLKEIWINSPALGKLRRNTAQRNHKCYLCYLKYLCGGLAKCYTSCAHISADKLGELIEDDFSCRTFDKIIHQSLRADLKANNMEAFDYPVVFDSISTDAIEPSGLKLFGRNNNVKSFKPFYV